MPEAAAWQFKDAEARAGPPTAPEQGACSRAASSPATRAARSTTASCSSRTAGSPPSAPPPSSARAARARCVVGGAGQDGAARALQQPRAPGLGRRQRSRDAGARGLARDLGLQSAPRTWLARSARRRDHRPRSRHEQDRTSSRSRRSRRASSAGPKLLVSGEAIVQTGGHTYWCCREASGPDEMRRAVREQVRAGADLIKIMGCHDTLEFTDEELDAVVDETHRNGLRITAHATYDACIRRMLEHGVDTIEHGGAMSDETIQLLARPRNVHHHHLRAARSCRPSTARRGACRRGRSRSASGPSPTRRATTGSSRRRRRASRSSSAPMPAARSSRTT